MCFVQLKVILLLTVLLEYLKLLINTKAKPVPLLASLVFLQCRNLPSPIQILSELCIISSIFYDLYLESLKYSVMIQLPSNIYIPSSTAESLLQWVQHWESKTNSPKYLRRMSFMIILKSELDLKIQAYPAWPSLFLCTSFHHEHKCYLLWLFFFFFGLFFPPVALSLLNCFFFSTPVPQP